MKKLIIFLMSCFLINLSLGSLFAAGPAVNSNPLSDVRVRQAIAYAIDMDQIAKTLLEGKAIVADSLIPNGPWKPSGLNAYAYNPQKAKELLKEAGWDSSYTLDVVFYYGDQLTVDIMTAVQAYLNMVGVKMNFRKLEGDVGTKLWTKPKDPINGPSFIEWDMVYAGSAALVMHEYFGKFPTGGPGNSHTPGISELDGLIDKTKTSADQDVQKKAFFNLQTYMNKNLPAIPLYYQQLFIFENKKIDRNGAEYGNAQFNYDWDIINWDITPDEKGKKVLTTNRGPREFFEHPWFNPGMYMYNKVLYDRLLVADGALVPKKGQLAKDFTVSDNGMKVTFTLRDNIKWHDGEILTPEDIKWSVEYALQIPASHTVFDNTFKSIEGADDFLNGKAASIKGIKIDGNAISFSFAKLDPNMLVTFSQFPPLPKKYFKGADPLKFQQSSYFQKPIGSGPFKLETVEMNDFITMVPFKKYYGGTSNIDEIVVYPSDDSDANLIRNVAAGKLNYGFTKNVANIKALEKMSNIRITPVSIPYTRLFYVNKFPKPNK